MKELGAPIEFSFEILHSATGAPIADPENLSLYIVRPGQTEAEPVVSTFEEITPTSWKTTISGAYVDSAGVLTAFVTADYGVSATPAVFQVGANLEVGSPVFVPFIARNPAHLALTGLAYNDLTLTTHITTGASRSVEEDEFFQLQDQMATNLPIYMVQISGDEIDVEGVLSYEVEASSMTAYIMDLVVGSPSSHLFTIRLDPYLGNVAVEFIADSVVLARYITNGVGEAIGNVAAGDYTVRLSRSGYTFSTNNVEVNIPDSLDTTQGLLELDGTSTQAAAQRSGFCKLTFRLLKANGEPLTNTKVLFFPRLALSGSGEGVVKQSLEVRTDPNGYGEVQLIYGLEMLVNVEGTRIFEEFTVPSEAEVDLFSLISFEDKGFDYYITDFPSGIRRTLNP